MCPLTGSDTMKGYNNNNVVVIVINTCTCTVHSVYHVLYMYYLM